MPEDNEGEQPKAATTERTADVEKQKTKDEEKQKTKDEEKLSIYKALAIKLKKELVKCRDELATLKRETQLEIGQLREQAATLEKTLELERITGTNANATLEAAVRNYKKQLELAERDMQTLQIEFDNYKTKATEILQQNQPVQSSSNRSFFEERHKQLKSLSEEQRSLIKELRAQVDELTKRKRELESEANTCKERLREALARIESQQTIENDRDRLLSENAALKSAVKLSKVWAQKQGDITVAGTADMANQGQQPQDRTTRLAGAESEYSADSLLKKSMTELSLSNLDHGDEDDDDKAAEDSASRLTNTGNLSHNGDVHMIKPTPIEIVSRSSVIADAQNRIDVLTKAYLDSEATKSLLIEEAQALKEEIRRLQRGAERIELADNLEYLKNVILKYLSLDSSQLEQKQRLIPVMKTVLKLSPEEVNKLNLLAQPERGGVTGMTTSFFKLT